MDPNQKCPTQPHLLPRIALSLCHPRLLPPFNHKNVLMPQAHVVYVFFAKFI